MTKPESSPAVSAASGFDPSRRAVARCIEIAREVRDNFLSPDYAVDQPLSSFAERFACDQVVEAIEDAFGLGTIEQCQLLGKPPPFERFRDSDGSGEADETGTGSAQRATARADEGGIAQSAPPTPGSIDEGEG